MPTNYPPKFKVNAIRRYEKGESIKALSQELHVAQSILYQWRNIYGVVLWTGYLVGEVFQ